VTSPKLQSPDLIRNISVEPNSEWDQFLVHFFCNEPLPKSTLRSIFEPLHHPTIDSMFVIGQIGQTMDGRIATVSGQSKYVNGSSGLTHLHQLRALVDAVVVGVGTVIADNPQLTVRKINGKSPARVVIDPRARLAPHHVIWQDDGIQKIWIVAEGTNVSPPPQVNLLQLPLKDGTIDPALILKNLFIRGLKRVLIEGGAETLSRFMVAKCLDRLHLIVAPIVMGSGRLSFNLPQIEHMDEALRLEVQTHLLGSDVLFDCDLSNQRVLLMTAQGDSVQSRNSE
jgi:diaminohydroxyphosphoribosylaminopyrimidine deaminase / 5-amino-6-(5-phosphoribosylamino)uracil reductase